MNCQEIANKLVTRQELAKEARARGVNVTERTLRYWAMRGLIPKPVIKQRRACYPLSLLETLEKIEPLRRKTIEQVKRIVWESMLFRCEAVDDETGVLVTFRAKRSQDGVERVSRSTLS